jgi:hypothetical protein
MVCSISKILELHIAYPFKVFFVRLSYQSLFNMPIIQRHAWQYSKKKVDTISEKFTKKVLSPVLNDRKDLAEQGLGNCSIFGEGHTRMVWQQS